MFQHPLRVTARLAAFILIVVTCLTEYVLCLASTGRSRDPRRRAEWLCRWSRRTLRVLGVSARYEGPLPQAGLLASNHLSYIDILVLSARCPTIFVSKLEVRRWPVFGWLAQAAGTVFIDRERRMEVRGMGAAFAPIIEAGLLLCVFPEGTSSDGHEVLRFHSSLFGPAEEHGWAVTPVWIGYALAEGSVEDEICYWRDMTLVPHLLNLFSKSGIEATVVYGSPVAANQSRKLLAHHLQERVAGFNQQFNRNLARDAAAKSP